MKLTAIATAALVAVTIAASAPADAGIVTQTLGNWLSVAVKTVTSHRARSSNDSGFYSRPMPRQPMAPNVRYTLSFKQEMSLGATAAGVAKIDAWNRARGKELQAYSRWKNVLYPAWKNDRAKWSNTRAGDYKKWRRDQNTLNAYREAVEMHGWTPKGFPSNN